MKEEFVPYELAVKLKELGFDEPCIAFYLEKVLTFHTHGIVPHFIFKKNSNLWYSSSAPLYQQAFRWFRENYNLFHEINVDKTTEPKFAYTIIEYELAQFFEGFKEDVLAEYLYYKYEEAELACLEKLIEIVEPKQQEQ